MSTTGAYRNPHTVLVRRQQAVAKGIIWIAAGVTISILVLIVGYIIVNGMVTRSVVDYPVTPFVEKTITIADGGAAGPETRMAILASRSLRLDDLTFEQLTELYRGRTPFWGFITGQNRNSLVIASGDTAFRTRTESFITGSRGFDDAVVSIDDAAGVEQALRSHDGAIAIVPADWVSEIDRVRSVGLRRTSVVVNPGVLALQDGRRLSHLTVESVRGLLSGTTPVWSDVGGPSVEIEPGEYAPLPVVPVIFRDSEAVQYSLFNRILDGNEVLQNARTAHSIEDFVEMVQTTPGAVGIIEQKYALEWDLPTIPIERITRNANLRLSFLVEPPSRAGAVGGISYIILNTLAMVVFVLFIATPIGLSAAIYLVEYAKQGRLLYILRLGTDTLAGIPSIIFGLFGMVFFSQFLGLKTGLVSGTLTLTLMILPTIVRTSEEALRSVPGILREGSLALGATKLQTIVRVVLPAASPGILTGVILGIGRAIGETAALLFTMGSNLALLQNLNSPIRVLSVHLYMLIRENISVANAFASATILIVIVFLVNYATTRLIGRLNRMAGR